MKILHIVEDFSIHSGGLRTVIKNLDFYLKSTGHASYILASNKEDEDEAYIFKSNNRWLYARGLNNQIDSLVNQKQIDVIHIHGVWLYPQYIGAKYAVKNKIPFVLSAHGMYQPWLWKKSTLKKKIYYYIMSEKWFSKASILHAITKNEAVNLAQLFKNNQIVAIPNLITVGKTMKHFTNTEKYILYLGRLNKTKGIDLLIKAFSELEHNAIKLKIAGGRNDYQKELEVLVRNLNLTNKVEFLGLLKDKKEVISKAWVMVSPTFSDVVGMVNLEAAAFKTPMITTYNTGLEDGWNTNGGKLINPSVKEVKKALKEALDWTLEERIENGQLLYNYVQKKYSWKSRLVDWIQLYEKVLKDEK